MKITKIVNEKDLDKVYINGSESVYYKRYNTYTWKKLIGDVLYKQLWINVKEYGGLEEKYWEFKNKENNELNNSEDT